MRRLNFMPFVVFVIMSSLLFLPFITNTVFASGSQASQGEDSTEATHDGLPGEVPFDRPVKEIKKFIAPMNEMDMFPCSDCHDEDWEVDSTRRELNEPHDEIPGKFVNHDSDNRWCLDCHSAKKRDKLRLINGKRIEFNEYYRICEQCHKRVYREWKMGVHGKRTGYWNGEKQWLHCAQCHNPHNPPFKAIEPMPAPRTPLNIKASSSAKTNTSSAGTH